MNRILLVTACCLLNLTLNSSVATAFASPTESAISSADGQIADQEDGFVFTVKPSESASLLVRKSLLAYDQQHEEVTLSPEQILIAEAAIVNELGSPQIEIGQRFVISESLLKKFIPFSQSINGQELEVWRSLTEAADFELAGITLDATFTSSAQTNVPAAPSDSNMSISTPLAAPEKISLVPSQTKYSVISWYWWFIISGLVGLVYSVSVSKIATKLAHLIRATISVRYFSKTWKIIRRPQSAPVRKLHKNSNKKRLW